MPAATTARRSQLAKRQAYRQVVVDCAEELFAGRGVAATRVEEIAQAAGIAPRTLYSVFSGKQEIVDEVCERRRVELVAYATERAATAGTSPFEALVSSVRASTEFFLGHPDYLRMELNEGLAWADERSSRSATWYDAFDGYVRLFERCRRDGSIRPGEPRAFARALLAMQQSQLAHWVTEGMHAPADPVVEAVETLVVRAFRSAD
jgi:AcrR family transcriptional regulator